MPLTWPRWLLPRPSVYDDASIPIQIAGVLSRARLLDPETGRPVVRVPPVDAQQAAKIRAQLLRYELYANSGRFQSRIRDKAIDALYRDTPQPFKWLVIPLDDDEIAQLVSPRGDDASRGLLEKLRREVDTTGGRREALLLPVLEQEAITLGKRFGDLVFVDDGEMYQTASPRSVLFGTNETKLPRLVPGIERYSVKMHLSDETYARLGGFDGSRELDKNDCLMAAVFTEVLRRAGADVARFEVLGEDATVCARLGSGKDSVEVGAIFRTLPDTIAVPGFALFSPTHERLPHVPAGSVAQQVVKSDGKPRVLAADALEFLRRRHPGLSKEDAFVRLFGEPILDIAFAFYSRGLTLELHPQNFLVAFDEKTGDVRKIYVRDVHGTNYSAAWRAKLGLSDICSVESLQDEFPGITQADLDGWFKRPDRVTGEPTLRARYEAPGIFGRNFDVYLSVFFYQSLVALEEHGDMDRGEVDRTMVALRDAVEAAAEKHGFDLPLMDAGGNRSFSGGMKVVFDNGMRGKALFRRPTDPEERKKYIEQHEAPLFSP